MTEIDGSMEDIEPIKDTAVSPAVGIGALALNFALKYHNINTVQDGTLYQQYKLEGRNLRNLHLSDVFETAIEIEGHLLRTSERIARLVVDAIQVVVEEGDLANSPTGGEPSAEAGER